MKLKDAKIKGWPEKKDIDETLHGCMTEEEVGFNQALDLINNLEFNPADYFELDKDKITHILDIEIRKQIKEGLKDNRWLNLTTLAQAIVDNKDVVKAKKEIIK